MWQTYYYGTIHFIKGLEPAYTEQCFILFCSFPLLFAFVVGGLGFEFCVFAPAGGMLFGVSGLFLLFFIIPLSALRGHSFLFEP